MKIVILDGFAANPGDISWEGLKALGECTIYDRTAPEEVLERSAGAEVILTNKVIINADHMAALPELKYIVCIGYRIQRCRYGCSQRTRHHCYQYPCIQHRFRCSNGICAYS